MKRSANKLEAGRLVTFTVCADSDLSGMVVSAEVYVPGVEFAGDFPDYLTRERRPHFPPLIKRADLSVALIDFDKNWQQAVETAETLSSTREQRIISVGVSSEVETEGLLKAMRAGCNEFLRKPVQLSHIQQCLEHWQSRASTEASHSERLGQVISFFGAKGGTGATTLAIHLAIELARRQSKVLLIDHHHQLGHVCLYLGIKQNQYHFDDLAGSLGRLDADLLQGFLHTHASGLHILASPAICGSRQACTTAQLEQILEFLRSEYDVIVIDSSPGYLDSTASLMELSDEIVMVSTNDVASIRDLSRYLEHHKLTGAAANKLRVVLNRTSHQDDISPDDVAKAIRIPVSTSIPLHPAVAAAMSAGEPFPSSKRNEFTNKINDWAIRLAPDEVRVPQDSKTKKRFGIW